MQIILQPQMKVTCQHSNSWIFKERSQEYSGVQFGIRWQHMAESIANKYSDSSILERTLNSSHGDALKADHIVERVLYVSLQNIKDDEMAETSLPVSMWDHSALDIMWIFWLSNWDRKDSSSQRLCLHCQALDSSTQIQIYPLLYEGERESKNMNMYVSFISYSSGFWKY